MLIEPKKPETYFTVHGGFYFNLVTFKTEEEAVESAKRLSKDSWSEDIIRVIKHEVIFDIPKETNNGN